MTAADTSAGDERIALRELGGDGPTIVYAHATGFHGACWAPVARRLDGFRHVAFDARGHGLTPAFDLPDEGPLDWSILGDDARRTVARVSPTEPVIGVGHSSGGAAMLMAALDAPQRFLGLVVYEPIVFPTAESGREAGDHLSSSAARRRATFTDRAEALANFASKPPLNQLSAECLDAYVTHGVEDLSGGGVSLRCAPAFEARAYGGGGTHTTWARLAELAVPVVIVSGRVIERQPSALSPLLAARHHLARHIELEHLGHFGPMQLPGQFAAIIADAAAQWS